MYDVFFNGFLDELQKIAAGKVRWSPFSRAERSHAQSLGKKVTKREVYPETTSPTGKRIPAVYMQSVKSPSSLAPKGGYSTRSLARSQAAISRGYSGPNPLLQATSGRT